MTEKSKFATSKGERVIKVLENDRGSKFTIQEILEKIPYNNNAESIRTVCENLLSKNLIKSENISTPNTRITVYYIES